MFKEIVSRMTGDTYKAFYRVGPKIYTAAFSDIYEATDRSSGNRVALKILNESGENIARKLHRNEDAMWEGELLVTLNHPNIIKGFRYDIGRKCWIAMEYIDGFTLHGYLSGATERRLYETELLDVFYSIASALSYIHKRGLIHLDVAPDNIMLQGDHAKLIDFGLTIPSGSSLVKGRMGTPSYMAPEMIRKFEATPSVDIFAFGIVMYELVTGIKLFGGGLKEERMTRVLNVHPLSPSKLELEDSCSSELEELIMRCVDKDPQRRPKRTQDLVNSLDAIRKGIKTGQEQ